MHTTLLDRLKPYLPLWVFLLPVISINLAYLVASFRAHIPQCIPYFSGCTSISSAGRIMPQKAIFLIGMVPAAILSMQLWQVSESWFVKGSTKLSSALILTGAVASLCLLVYVTTLGIPGEVYTLFRKFGVLLYFGCTFIAQLLLIRRLQQLSFDTGLEDLGTLASRLLKLCVLILLCGIVIVPISLIEDPIRRKEIENIVEWNYALFLHIYYLALYPTWRRYAT